MMMGLDVMSYFRCPRVTVAGLSSVFCGISKYGNKTMCSFYSIQTSLAIFEYSCIRIRCSLVE